MASEEAVDLPGHPSPWDWELGVMEEGDTGQTATVGELQAGIRACIRARVRAEWPPSGRELELTAGGGPACEDMSLRPAKKPGETLLCFSGPRPLMLHPVTGAPVPHPPLIIEDSLHVLSSVLQPAALPGCSPNCTCPESALGSHGPSLFMYPSSAQTVPVGSH